MHTRPAGQPAWGLTVHAVSAATLSLGVVEPALEPPEPEPPEPEPPEPETQVPDAVSQTSPAPHWVLSEQPAVAAGEGSEPHPTSSAKQSNSVEPS